jgi:hypothetical protein
MLGTKRKRNGKLTESCNLDAVRTAEIASPFTELSDQREPVLTQVRQHRFGRRPSRPTVTPAYSVGMLD